MKAKAGEVWKDTKTGQLFHLMIVNEEDDYNYGTVEYEGHYWSFSRKHSDFTNDKVCLGDSEMLVKRNDGTDRYIFAYWRRTK